VLCALICRSASVLSSAHADSRFTVARRRWAETGFVLRLENTTASIFMTLRGLLRLSRRTMFAGSRSNRHVFAVAAAASHQRLQVPEADSQAFHWCEAARVALYVEVFHGVFFSCC
jgi:hypothetical protein